MPEMRLEPFQRVLVRDNDGIAWKAAIFSHQDNDGTFCASCEYWSQCLPYEGNEHLLGTTDSPTPPEPEFKWGDKVEVKVEESHEWIRAIFCWEESSTYYCMIYPSSCCLWKYCRHSNW